MLQLSYPQHIFLNQLETKFKAFVGGFGSGKTFVGCIDLLLFMSKHPKVVQGYFAPTYPQIRDIFYPTFEEAAHLLGFHCKINVSNKEVHVYRGKAYYGTIICRSMEIPSSIVGFKIARALVDEIDIMKKDKAEQAWRKIIARMRLVVDGVVNGIGVTTTPEGFNFVYQTFKKDPSESYSMVQCSTYENEQFLPPDYIPSLMESYPPNIVQAYLNGQFVNLTSGTIYSEFDRTLNHSTYIHDEFEPLFIGMDFNVDNMSAIVHAKYDGLPIATDELIGLKDTPAMIDAINVRYNSGDSAGRSINIFPDASGNSRKTVNASETDISLLEDAGFTVHVNPSNPSVRDRINCMNAMFHNINGERRYKVNTDRCPSYTENLEQQIYQKNGEPDKSLGNDHTNDGAGYFISFDYPIIKPTTDIKVNFAI